MTRLSVLAILQSLFISFACSSHNRAAEPIATLPVVEVTKHLEEPNTPEGENEGSTPLISEPLPAEGSKDVRIEAVTVFTMNKQLGTILKYLSNEAQELKVAETTDAEGSVRLVLYAGNSPETDSQQFVLKTFDSTSELLSDKESDYVTFQDGEVTELCSGSRSESCDINFYDGRFVITIDGKDHVIPNNIASSAQ